MAALTTIPRPIVAIAQLSPSRFFSCSAALAKKEKGVFLTDEAMEVRDARRKKREEEAAKKAEFVSEKVSPQEKYDQKLAMKLAKYREENAARPTYTYSKEFIASYTPDLPGVRRRDLNKSALASKKAKAADKAMERAHRRQYLEVPLPVIHANYVKEAGGLHDLALTAIHYNIAKDVLRQQGLLLTIPLNIRHTGGDFVHRGNLIKPATVQSAPKVLYTPSTPETLYTLVMSTPDGNIYSYREEVLHWMVTNIPGNDVSKGDETCPYMPPIPCEGTGYHRYAFTLLKQEGRIDGMETVPSRDLEKRSWSTADFVNKHDVAVRGLAFYQAKWDASVGDVFDELGCGEPVYKLEKTKDIVLEPKLANAIYKKRAYLERKQ